MIAGLKPYPVMKDSGVEWLGEMPKHWEVRRNGRLFAQRNETGYPDLPILEVSLRTGVRVRDFANSTRKQVMSERDKYKRAAKGDIAYNMMRMWQGAVGVVPEHGLISPAYVVARPLPGSNSSYFERLFRTPAYMQEVDNYSRGIVKDRNRLYWEDFKHIPTCYPPPKEQAAIVRYLDHVDRRVRRLVRAKRKLIALLTEQKQAIIHRAVTRGLDPEVPLKDSGVEWLGEVPAHWEVVPLRYLATKFGSGVTPRGGATSYQEEGVPFLRSQNIHFTGLRLEGVARIAPEVHRSLAGSHVQPRDVLLNITGASLGRVCVAPVDFDQGNVNQHVCIIRTKRARLMPEFLSAFLATQGMQREIQFEQNGASREGLTLDAIRSFVVVLPPISEQSTIGAHLGMATKDIDTAIIHINREINLLTEFRTRLTAGVVTGKLDVREAAATLPEIDPLAVDDEPDTLDAESETDLEDLDVIAEEVEA